MNPDRLQLRWLLLLGLGLLAGACTTAPVGTPLASNDSVAPPAVAVGDQWTYHVRDGFTGLDRGTVTYEVEKISAGSMSVVRRGLGPDLDLVFDTKWNWLRAPATNMQVFDYAPAYPAFDYPLAPGKTWRARLKATDPAKGEAFPVLVEGKALGWERVKTAAGDFDAIKVQRVVYLDYFESNVRGASHILEYDWYAPAVKQSVRRETRSRYWSFLGAADSGFTRVRSGSGRSMRVRGGGRDGGPQFREDDWLVYELASFKTR